MSLAFLWLESAGWPRSRGWDMVGIEVRQLHVGQGMESVDVLCEGSGLYYGCNEKIVKEFISDLRSVWPFMGLERQERKHGDKQGGYRNTPSQMGWWLVLSRGAM